MEEKMAKKTKHEVIQEASYEIFIVLLTILSIFNLLVFAFARQSDVWNVAQNINLLISLIFFVDFLVRLRKAGDRRNYFLKGNGWLDLVGSIPIPGFNIARSWRIFHARRMLSKEGTREVVREVAENRADAAIIFISLAVIYLLEFGSIFILRAEANVVGSNIDSAGDALWWVLVTISTVGYGDLYPVTNSGRFVSIFVIIAGVGVFGTLSGYLANAFLGQRNNAPDSQTTAQEDPVLSEIAALRKTIEASQNWQVEANTMLQSRLEKVERLLEESRL